MAEDQNDVERDADKSCTVCKGGGWHWGWNEFQEPVMLRCPCVDWMRAIEADLSPRQMMSVTDKQ